MMTPLDALSRPLRDLRLSVTDRCNMRCPHCMPRDVFGPGYHFLPRKEILTFEELSRVARVFVDLGVKKIRLTGGEPLLRHDVPELVRQLAEIPGVEDLALTTNGVLASQKDRSGKTLAERLKAAGLTRVTLSLDSMVEDTFKAMTDSPYGAEDVLRGLHAVNRAGFKPVKVNMVVRAGVNDQDIVPMARWARERGHILRFIEFMDVGASNGWRMDQVFPAKRILERIANTWQVEAADPEYYGEVVRRYRYADGRGRRQ